MPVLPYDSRTGLVLLKGRKLPLEIVEKIYSRFQLVDIGEVMETMARWEREREEGILELTE